MADWQKGDLALCIDNKPDRLDPKAALLSVGRVYLVGAVGRREDSQFALAFRELPGDTPNTGWGWTARRFIKVTPPAADEFDRETIELEQRKPVEEVQP